MPTVTLAALLLAPAASGQNPGAALFRKGLALYARGDTAAACRAFEQSYKLEPASGTLFNLATCHAKEGRYWQARREFLELGREMQSAGKDDKAQIARDRARRAAEHLPKLGFQFPTPSNVQRIRIDGKPVPEARWQAPIAVRTGAHTVSFAGNGLQPRTIHVNAEGDGAIVHVTVPTLAGTSGSGAQAPAVTPPGGGSARLAAGAHGTGRQSWWTTKRTIGVVAAGVGVVALGAGAFYGFTAISQKSDADRVCGGPNGNCISQANASAATTDIHTANTNATYSDIGLGIGIGALVAGGYLVLTGAPTSTPPADTSRVDIVPAFDTDGGRVQILGRF